MLRKQILSLDVSTPTDGWKLKFTHAYEGKDKIIAVASLTGGSPCCMMGRYYATLEINQVGMLAKPVEYYVVSKLYKKRRLESEDFTGIHKLDEIQHLLEKMQPIFSCIECQTSTNSR